MRTRSATSVVRRAAKVLVIAMLASSIGPGCSSEGTTKAHRSASDEKPSTTTTTRSGTALRGSTTTTTVAPAGSVPAPTAPPSGAHQQFCDGVVAAEQQLVQLYPEKIAPDQYLAAAKKVFADATTAAPPDLKPDMVVVDQYVQSRTSLEQLGGALPASVGPAASRVQRGFSTNCHLDL